MVQHFLMISDSIEKHGSIVQHFLMVSDSMEKHGEHGATSVIIVDENKRFSL